MDILTLNFLYAGLGSILGIILLLLTVFLLDMLMSLKIRRALKNGNAAVAIVTAGLFTGIGIMLGLILGMALN